MSRPLRFASLGTLLVGPFLHGEGLSLSRSRVSGGGGSSNGGEYAVHGTLGQAEMSGHLSGGSLSLAGGFRARARPVIGSPSSAGPVAAGAAAVLSASAIGPGPFSYQWFLDGAPIPGATGPAYSLPSAQCFHAGLYTVTVTDASGLTTSQAATLAVAAPPSSGARLLNLSTRARALSGSDVLIPGFVIQGEQNKRLLIRAVGPTLAGFGITDHLPDPRLTLKRETTIGFVDVAANDDWGTSADASTVAATAAELGAFDLEPGGKDAALLVDLVPGTYTVVCDDGSGGSGIAIVELYDADADATGSRLINISNRGYVGGGGNVMIPGFVVSSEGPRRFLIRGVGPTLEGFGVAGVLPNPRLDIFRSEPDGSSTLVLSNNDWAETDPAHTAAAAAMIGAFELEDDSKDAAFVVTLLPGAYTIQASDVGGATGVALVEIYEVP